MKTLLIISLALIFAIVGYPQSINYNSKSIKLIPDESFLPNADWDDLFYDAEAANAENGTGYQKDFAIAANGNVIISNRSNYTVNILDKNGALLKTFGKKGGYPGEFLYRQNFHGILDGRYLIFSDHQGRINIFDLDGNYIKMITIDFMPLNIYPGKNGKIIIKGHVPMGNAAKNVLAILDYSSEKYEIIYSLVEPYEQSNKIVIPYNGSTILRIPGFINTNKWFTGVCQSESIVSAMSGSDVVKVFSPQANSYSESEFTVKTEPIIIMQEDKDAYYRNFKNKLKELGVDSSYAEKIKNDDFFPEYMPYFYNIIADESNNCLFFFYNNEDKDHLFKAYSTSGEFMGQSEFISEGYDILFQENPVIFHDGYVYATALKEGESNPLRVMKFRMMVDR